MRNLAFFIVLCIILKNNLFADTPITSTYWADKYQGIPIIAEVIQKKE